MLQNQTNAPPRHRVPIPVIPTLVIGVGRYGKEVGVQLAARLMLTEDGLRPVGLNKPLLVHRNSNGDLMPGFVRIMELNWKQWAGSGYTPDTFLTDIDISGASVAEEGTPPQQREEDMLNADRNGALLALPQMVGQMFTISEQLRIHDTPMQLGSFLTLGKDQNFTMRVVVVCAAREAETAALLPRFLELLGQVYVVNAQLAKGIQVICYAGATSRAEHRQANGDDAEYDRLLDAEVARILPLTRRNSRVLTVDSLLDQLNRMWQNASPQIIESCYVIDTQLANMVTAVQLRPDEPDETVVVAALALTMFITSGADIAIRGIRSRRWDLSTPYVHTEQGLFTSLGVGSYALDHPRLRRLIYDYVTGMFLKRAQPIRYGDQGKRRHARAGHQDEELLDGDLENQLCDNLEKVLNDYKEKIDFRTIEREMPKAGTDANSKKAINFKKAISILERIDPEDRAKIKGELEHISLHMVKSMEENALQQRILKRQQRYQKFLEDASFKYQNELLLSPQAPLVQMYRFTLQSLDALRKEANKVNAPMAGPNLIAEKRDFAAERSRCYDEEMTRRVDDIKRTLKHRPNPLGAAGRALATAPLLAHLANALAPLGGAIFGVLSWFGLAPVLVTLYGIISSLPAWVNLLGISLPLWSSIFFGHRTAYRNRLKHHLQELVKRYEVLLKETDLEAWRWALAEALAEQEILARNIRPLCRPKGIISRLRDGMLSEQFTAREQILERIFFDEELQKNLKEVSRQLMQLDHLWLHRWVIFNELISRQPADEASLKKWLREEAERIYTNDTQLITDLVSEFLEDQTVQRLKEMWYSLSTVAVPFLRHAALSQDDPTIPMEFFGIHGLQDLPGLDSITRQAGVEILNSADRLRWIFMSVQVGMHLESMKFAIEAQIP